MQSAKPIEPGCMALTYGMTLQENNWIQCTVIKQATLPEDVMAPDEDGTLWEIDKEVKVVRARGYFELMMTPEDQWEHKMVNIVPERFLMRIDPDADEKSVTKNTDKEVAA